MCGKVGKITLEKIWSKTTQSFSLPTTRKDILTHDSSFTQYRTLPELYPDGSTCFVMAYSHYGCQAEVITIDKEHRGRIQLSVIEPTVGILFFVTAKKWELLFTSITFLHFIYLFYISKIAISFNFYCFFRLACKSGLQYFRFQIFSHPIFSIPCKSATSNSDNQ